MSQLGHYELLGELGCGGMGVVYRARHARLRRDVALKTFLGSWRTDPEAQARFEREAELLARLNHPNVVRVHAFGIEGGQPYLAMDLLSGGSLKARVAADGPLAAEEVVHVLQEVAAGLSAAHEAGILHRDLKPENVLLAESGQAVVTDFGLARGPGTESLTQTGQLLGTPAYMPPEQAAGEKDQLGPASDVYSLGALGYFLVTGRAPFGGASLFNVLHQLLSEPPRPPSEFRPGLPQGLERVLLRCLEKKPAARYPSVDAVAEDLSTCLRQEPAGGRRGLLLAALTGSLVLGGLAAWTHVPLAGPHRPAPQPPVGESRPPVATASTGPADVQQVLDYPEELESAVEICLVSLHGDPRVDPVAGTVREPLLRQTFLGLFPEANELLAELEQAVSRLSPGGEASARCRLALIQLVYVARPPDYHARAREQLEQLNEDYDDLALAHYVRAIHLKNTLGSDDPLGSNSKILEELKDVKPGTLAAVDLIVAYSSRELASLAPERAGQLLEVAATRAVLATEAEGLSARQQAEGWLLRARLDEEAGRYLEARLAYDEAVARDRDWTAVQNRRASFLASLGDHEQARAHRSKQTRIAAEALDGHFADGGKWEHAVGTRERVAQLNAEGAHARASDPQEALRLWDMGRALAPKSGEFFALRGWLLFELGDYKAALRECDLAPTGHGEIAALGLESRARLDLGDD